MIPRSRSSNRSSIWFLVAPAALFMLVFFLYPMAGLLIQGFSEGGKAFLTLFGTDLYLRVLWATFETAAIVTVAALLLAYPVSYLLATTTRGWRLVGFMVVLLPFWTSILVRTYAWMVLLGRNGIINRVLLDAGIISSPITMLNSPFAVQLGMVHVMLPFMILPIYNAMLRVDRDLAMAARSLGAGAFSIFSRIYLPLTMQGIIAGCTLVFVLSLGFFITPALLGGGRVTMFAMVIEQQIRETLNWPLASAMSILLLVLTLAVFWLLNRLNVHSRRWSA